MKNENYKIIENFFNNNEIELFGVVDLQSIIELNEVIDSSISSYVTKLKYAISYGIKLSSSILDTIDGKPNLLYAFHYRRVNETLDLIGIKMSNLIERKGYNAMPFPASQVLDFNKQKAHISHRHVAYYAGLGWFGRNNLLVNKKYGSQIRYATILTNMHLPADKKSTDNCGMCKICMNACPAKAINDSSKDFNSEACYNKLKEFSKMPGIYHLICGICIASCKGKFNGKN